MSVDRTKVLEAAQKYLGKGNYDRAIGELRKLVKDDPSDIRTWLKIGDLYTRKGSRSEAIETYARVANQYGEQGFFLKAVAVYKQILKLDPNRLDIQLKLAQMYEMLHLVSDALATYEHVAASFARAGDIDKALETLQKMSELDPENIPVRIKCAEALSKAGRLKEAAEEFEAGAKLLKAQGRIDDYIKVAERLLYHRADAVDQARELAQLYLERDDPKRALSKLQLCFKADPKDISTLELLAEAFNQLGQLPKTISVYKEVARIHHEANRAEERAQVLRRILELDPGDREARQAMASYAQGGSAVRRDIQPPASAIMQPSARRPPPEEEEEEEEEEPELIEVDEDVDFIDMEDEEILIVDDDDIEMEIPVAAAKPSVPPDVQREAQIARLLTECDVFLRYGLKQKVVEQLTAVLDLDPAHVEARERLKNIFLEDGRIDDAIGELLTLADVLSVEQSAASVLYLRQILEYDPDHIEARSRLGELGGSAAARFDELDPSTQELEPAVEPSAEDSDEIFFVDDEQIDDEAESSVIPVPASLELPEDERLNPISAATATDAAPYVSEPPKRPAIAPPAGGDGLPEVGAELEPPSGSSPGLRDPLAPMSPEEFDEVPLRPSAPGEMEIAVSQRLSMPPGEVEEILDEADFFIAQGLMDEARGTLADALESYPNHMLIQDKYREVEEAAAAAAASRASSPEIALDQSFELAEKLAEGFDGVDDTQAGSDVLDVEQVFAQFKKGVQAQVGAEDTETHFDLGIAYKEMGLLDDAIGEFRLCLTNTSRVCIAQTMIGLCHIEKGEIAEAISHFKKGLYADQKTEREELGLYFELGGAYEHLHDPKEALYYYQKVQKRDGTFRNVDERIDNLSRPQAAEANSPPQIAQDDIDRAFDDLMGED